MVLMDNTSTGPWTMAQTAQQWAKSVDHNDDY